MSLELSKGEVEPLRLGIDLPDLIKIENSSIRGAGTNLRRPQCETVWQLVCLAERTHFGVDRVSSIL